MGNNSEKTKNARWNTLTKKPTVDLIRRIVEDSDKLALKVMLETRRLFRLKDKPPLTLPEYLFKLRDRMMPFDRCDINQCMLADCSYDLTLAKYSNIPDLSIKRKSSYDKSLKATEVDCRNYFRAFLRGTRQRNAQETIVSQVHEESFAGKKLQNLVYKNFLRSKAECKRDTPFSIRYTWQAQGTKYNLWYPSYMTAKEFNGWLKENVIEIDLKAPDSQKHLQSLIDTNLKRGGHIGLDELDNYKNVSNIEKNGLSSIEMDQGRRFVDRLSIAVAKKKVENIEQLRPGIAKLGKNVIERMILQIFSDISEDDYQVTRIASTYGVSKPTLSRFAGSQWFKKYENREKPEIPDLWRNTAKTLASSPEFIETLINSDPGANIENLLSLINRERGKKNVR